MKEKNQRTKDRIFTIFLLLGISFTVFAQTDPTVVATAPTPNALNVDNTATMGFTFNETMDAATLKAANVKISGNYGEPFSFPALGANATTAVFDPDRDFFPGEEITATLTTGVASSTGDPLVSPFTYRFTAGVSPDSPGEFPNGQNTITTAAVRAQDVTVADLDGDGDLDAVSASKNAIAWYQNDGNGNFGALRTIYVTAVEAQDVTTGDLDGDGDLDVVSAYHSNIAWYQNDGNGNFGSQQTITTAVSDARNVTIGDLDGDGDLDVLSASRNDNRIAWYENDGDGNFGALRTITPVGTSAAIGVIDVTTGDLDGDGDLDVVSSSISGISVAWYENDGNGNFSGQRTITTESGGMYSVTTSDLDGDGDLDVLSTSLNDNAPLSWYRNDGSGNFGSQRIVFGIGANTTYSATIADMDGDGDLDALSASFADGTIAWYENSGDGNFGDQRIISTAANGAFGVATGDLDGDGDLDVLSASFVDNRIAWYENAVRSPLTVTATDPAANALGVDNAAGISFTFSEAIDAATLTADNIKILGNYGSPFGFPAPGSNTAVAVFDPDRDFFPGEVVTATLTTGVADSAGNPLASPFTYSFIAGVDPNSSGEFPNGQNTIFEGSQGSFTRNDATVADLDGDGDLDVIAAHENNGGVWYENDGSGNLGASQSITPVGTSFKRIIPADLDGDGNRDVLAITDLDSRISWFLNDGSENFAKGIDISSSPTSFRDLTIGDLDGDGDLDMIVTSGHNIAWYPNDGLTFSGAQRIPAIFGTERTITTAATGASGVATADMDGDGDLDVVSTFPSSGIISWFENDGSGSFGTGQTITLGVRAQNVIVADLNGDGRLDVISTSTEDNRIAWYPNYGNSTFRFGSQRTITGAVDGIQDVTVADMDGDGDLDVLSASANDNKIAWYPNDGNGSFDNQLTITAEALGALSVSTGDLDGDGDLDVLSARSNKGTIAWYENAASSLRVTATDPAANALGVDNTVTLGLTFNQTIDATTLTADNVKITGNYGQPLSFPAPNTNATMAVFNPDRDFFPGEEITATLNTEVASSAGLPLDSPFTYRFTAGVSPDSPGEFPNGQNIIFEYFRGSNRNDVTVADLDGDGDLDVISAYEIGNGAAWFPNDGSGNLGAPLILDSGVNSFRRIIPADLDGDGDLEVLAVTTADSQIDWYLNDGSENFTDGMPISFSTVNVVKDLAIGDLDGDGDLDVLSASFNKIAWHPNDGLTTDGVSPPSIFGTERTITTAAAGASGVATGDLDGDGDLDVVSSSADDNKIAWYPNDGSGNFGAQRIITQAALGAEDVIVADLDDDGNLDVISTSADDNRIAWYRNDGNGNFVNQQTITTAVDGIRDVTVADMDGDGNLDVLSASFNDNRVAWYPNDGNGNFGDQQTITTAGAGVGYLAVATGDLDGDGDLDVFSARSDATIAWYENAGSSLRVVATDPAVNALGVDNTVTLGLTFNQTIDATTLTADNIKISGNYGRPLGFRAPSVNATTAVFDPDRDFFPGEVVTATLTTGVVGNAGTSLASPFTYSFNTGVSPDSPGEFPNGRNTIFEGSQESPRNDVAVADLDGDGDLDVLAAHEESLGGAWYENNGDGNFGALQSIDFGNGSLRGLITADMDGDRDLDVLALANSDTRISLYLNDGSENFITTVGSTSYNRVGDIATGDLDGDGDLDLLLSSFHDNKIAWYPNDGLQYLGAQRIPFIFGTEQTITTAAAGANGVAIADLDGDGDLDALSASANDNKIAWYPNDGNGNFGAQQTITTAAAGALDVIVADLDGDGDLDVLSTSADDNRVAWYSNDGNGNFGTQQTITTAVDGIRDVTVADMDGDGDLDVLSASFNDNRVAWYPNDGSGSFGDQLNIATEALGALSVVTGDLDGDGDLDVLSARSDKGGIAWYENTGATTLTANCTDPFAVQLDANGTATIAVDDIDNGSIGATAMDIDITDFDCSNLGANTVTLTVTNALGATDSCTTTVTVEDSMAPVADMATLPDITGECGATVSVVPTATDNCGGTVTATTNDPLTYDEQGTFTVTWTYDDGNGNTSTQEQNVIVENSTAPPLADVAVLLDVRGECSVAITEVPTATDSCGGTISATTNDPLTYDEQGTFTVTWTYDAGNGNISTQEQNITVEDSIAPVADMAVLPNITGGCGATVTIVPTATDNCGGTVTATTNDPLAYPEQGTYTVTWSYDDGNGNTSTQNQNVIVENSIASATPDMATLPDVRGECRTTITEVPTATADCGGTVVATTNDPLEYDQPGTFIITWTYNVGNGNTSTQTQNVIVKDAIAPVADMATLPDVIGGCGATVTILPTATDNCAGTVTATTTDSLTYPEQGTYTVTWTYDDGNGNTNTQTQTVIVENSITPPIPDMVSLTEVRGECSATVTAVPTATDNCAGTIIATTNDPLEYDRPGTFTITWTYDTGNGNISTQTQTVIVQDLMPPTAIVRDITVELDENGRATIDAGDIDNGSTDNCGIADLSLDMTVFDCPELGDTVVELTVTDMNSNSHSASATVTFTAPDNNSDGVADTCGPEITIVPGQGVSPNGDGINDTWVIENIADYPEAVIRVFDRNGREVFRTDDYRNDWGGTQGNGGKLLPVGSYYYIVHPQRPSAKNVTGWFYLNY